MENYYRALTEVCKYLSSEDEKQTFVNLATNPETFLQHNCYPLLKSRKGKNWPNTEIEITELLCGESSRFFFFEVYPFMYIWLCGNAILCQIFRVGACSRNH